MKPRREFVDPGSGRSVLAKRTRHDAFRVAWHHHPEVELTRIDAGTGRRAVGPGVEGFGPGDLVLLGPGLPHTWTSEGCEGAGREGAGREGAGRDAARASVVQFDAGAALAAAGAFRETRGVAGLLAGAAAGLWFPPGSAASALDRLLDADAAGDAAEVPGLLLALLAGLCRADARPLGATPDARVTDPAVEAMTRLLQGRSRGPVSLAEVAAAAHLSESAAARRFAAAMGQSVTGYLHRLRVQAAETLLLGTDRGVADVGAAAGFPNASHFHRVFRRHHGVPPAAWRRERRRLAGG